MIEVLQALRQQTRGPQKIAVLKLLRREEAQAEFKTRMMEDYGWDGSTLVELFKIVLENLPEILALILKLVA